MYRNGFVLRKIVQKIVIEENDLYVLSIIFDIVCFFFLF